MLIHRSSLGSRGLNFCQEGINQDWPVALSKPSFSLRENFQMGLLLESQKWRHFWIENILKSEGLVEPREIQGFSKVTLLISDRAGESSLPTPGATFSLE